MARPAARAARAAVLTLLDARTAEATICPSEAARAIGGADWRGAMAEVHAAVDALVAEGAVRLSWRGKPLAARDGPYRIAWAAGRKAAPGQAPPRA